MKLLVDLIKSGNYIDIFYAKTCATMKISTVMEYHVVLATLLFKIKRKFSLIICVHKTAIFFINKDKGSIVTIDLS